MARTRSAWASTRPTCGPWPTPASRLGRGLLPGGRPRRPRRRARPGAAARRGPRQGPARLLHPARGGRRGAARLCRAARRCADGDGATSSASTSWCTSSRRRRLRALVGHLARAGVISARAVAGRPRGGADRSAPFDGRARRLPLVGRGGRQGALAPVPRVWAYVEGDGCRRATILRHFGDPPRRRRPTGACCDVCDPGSCPAPPPPTRSRSRTSTTRSSRWRARRSRRSGAHLRGDPPRRARTKLCATRYDGLPAYGDLVAHAPRGHPRAVDELIDAGRLETTGGPYPMLRRPPAARLSGRRRSRRVLISGAGTNLQALLDQRPRRREDRDRRRRLVRPRRVARRRARPPASSPPSSRSPTTPTAPARDARSATGSTRSKGRAGRAGRLHGAAHRRSSSAASPADRQRAPVAAAGLPRAARDRAGGRGTGAVTGRDRALRRRGRGHRADHPAGGPRAFVSCATSPRSRSECTASSTSCCRAPSPDRGGAECAPARDGFIEARLVDDDE